MAKWSSFKWSDGTKWADGAGVPQSFISLIDRLAYRLSLKITQVAPQGSTTAPTIHTMSAEVGSRAQLPSNYEAFIDRSEQTQRISLKVFQTFDSASTVTLTTESGDTLTTEDGDSLVVGLIVPFVIDNVHMLASQRSRQQPTG